MHLTKTRLLIKRQWLEHAKAYYIGALAIIAILSCLFLITWHWRTSFNGDVRKGIFLLILLAGGGVFASSLLKDLGNKQKGMWLLVLPAPVSAKLFTALFYSIIVYVLAYTALFLLVQEVFLLLVGSDRPERVDLLKNGFYNNIFTFINYQSIVLLGSVWFNKSQFLKTLILVIVGFFAINTGNTLLLKVITGETTITSSLPLDYFQFVHDHENVYVYLQPPFAWLASILLHFFLPFMLWTITYFRLHEKQL
jgi:hypothetical protein